MTTTPNDLTLDLYTEDGARTRFVETDPANIDKTLRQLVSPRLFSPPLLTFASEHSVSAIPTRTIDVIKALTPSAPTLALPSGWTDAVEVSDDAVPNLADLEAVAAAESKHVMLVEIHTVGDWMIRLKLETVLLETDEERLDLWRQTLELPTVLFRLKDGGIGVINSANIVRGTVCPPIEGLARTALAADLMQSVRP